jgi:hypothetical protein
MNLQWHSTKHNTTARSNKTDGFLPGQTQHLPSSELDTLRLPYPLRLHRLSHQTSPRLYVKLHRPHHDGWDRRHAKCVLQTCRQKTWKGKDRSGHKGLDGRRILKPYASYKMYAWSKKSWRLRENSISDSYEWLQCSPRGDSTIKRSSVWFDLDLKVVTNFGNILQYQISWRSA